MIRSSSYQKRFQAEPKNTSLADEALMILKVFTKALFRIYYTAIVWFVIGQKVLSSFL